MMIDKYPLVERIIRLALEEDLGCGDLTTDGLIDSRLSGKAHLVTREDMVIAGIPIFQLVFREVGPGIEFQDYFFEGDAVPGGREVCFLKGPLSTILKGERTALNFLQRMSGIATLTRKYVEKAGTAGVKILDTRKTAPGLRWFDKYAVRIGGGFNHRFGLFDGILIKDNHIAAVKSISRAVALVRENAPHTVKVEVEVEDLEGVEDALNAGADAILLDNMETDKLRRAVEIISGRALVEASGGVSLDTVADIAATGVDLISVGALTHSAKAVDLSLEVIVE